MTKRCPTCLSDDPGMRLILYTGELCDDDAFHDAPASEPTRLTHPYEASPRSQYKACHLCGRPETSPVHNTPTSEPTPDHEEGEALKRHTRKGIAKVLQRRKVSGDTAPETPTYPLGTPDSSLSQCPECALPDKRESDHYWTPEQATCEHPWHDAAPETPSERDAGCLRQWAAHARRTGMDDWIGPSPSFLEKIANQIETGVCPTRAECDKRVADAVRDGRPHDLVCNANHNAAFGVPGCSCVGRIEREARHDQVEADCKAIVDTMEGHAFMATGIRVSRSDMDFRRGLDAALFAIRSQGDDHE